MTLSSHGFPRLLQDGVYCLLAIDLTTSLKLKAWLWETVLHMPPRHEKGRMGGTPHVENGMVVPRGIEQRITI